MKKIGAVIFLFTLCVIIVSSCGTDISLEMLRETGAESEEKMSYIQITAEQARQLMDDENDYVILDVRTDEEYNQGHIPGAILIPDFEIAVRAEEELPDKDRLILVYCRSGRRSKLASQTLADMGYRNVKEFGGIIDWKYEITK